MVKYTPKNNAQTSRKLRGPQEEPSAASLREIPPSTSLVRFNGRGPEARANARAYFAVLRGRPREGEQATGRETRALCLPDAAWAELERRAKERKMTPDKFLRLVVAECLYTTPKVPPKIAEEKLDLLLAEQKLVLEQLGRLTSELRERKARTAKRVRSVRERAEAGLIARTQPSESDIVRAQKILARHRRK